MSLSMWIVVGIVSGFVASKIIGARSAGLLTNIVLGTVGAVVGGLLFRTSEMSDVSGLNDYGFVVAFVGAAGTLAAYHLLVRSSR